MKQTPSDISFPGNFIHYTAIIGEGVKLGTGNTIGPYCILHAGVVIGNNNTFLSHCSIGGPPEHRTHLEKGLPDKPLIIGNRNRFNEYVTINSGVSISTKVGNDCFLLRGAHVGHDSVIKNNVTLSCNSIVGGHSEVEDHVNFGLGSACHQFSYVGMGAMIGMGAVITKKTNIPPFMILVGNPARPLKTNQVLIDRLDLGSDDVSFHRERYSTAFFDRNS